MAKRRQIVQDQLKNLQPHHLEIARLRVQGVSDDEIAGVVGLRVETVKAVQKQEVYLKHLASIKDSLDDPAKRACKIIDEIVPDAIEVQKTIMMDEGVSPGHRLNAAQDFMDRSAAAPKKKTTVESQHTHMLLTPADLAEIRATRAGRLQDSAGTSDAVAVRGE